MKKIMHFLFNRDHFLIIGLVCLVSLLITGMTFTIPMLQPIGKALKNFSATDLFFQIENKMSKADYCKDIVIVDMTELNSRGDIANLLLDIYAAKPKALGIDLVFEGEKDDLKGNVALEAAVGKVAPISVFANKLTDFNAQSNVFSDCTMSYFRDMIPVKEGYTNIADNMEHSVVRNLSISQMSTFDLHFSFPAKLAQCLGEHYDKSQDNLTINYHPIKFMVIPFDQVKVKKTLLKGKIVLVGAMKEERDTHLTPLGKMAGIELQAYSLLTLLEHKDIVHISNIYAILIAILVSYMYELFLESISVFVRTRRTYVRLFLTESRLLLTFLPMLFLSFISITAYMLFEIFNISINMVVVLLLLSFVGFCRRLYLAIIKVIEYHNNNH